MIARRGNPWLAAYAVSGVLLLYAPIALLLLFSFNESHYLVFPMKGLTLDWYRRMAGNTGLFSALRNSLEVAAVASIAATMLGLLGAKAVTRYRFPGRAASIGLVMAPLVIPEIVLGTSLLAFLLAAGLNLSLGTVMLGHVLLCAPFAFAVLSSRFAGFDPSLEEASLDLGENGLATFVRVTTPLVLPGIIASLLLCFLISFDEFLIAFFLAGTDQTLPIFMYSQLRFPKKLPEVLALGTCVILSSIALIILAELLRRRGSGTEQ
ncbi:MAG TPA: ABC transporter permease [Alphaproteobacteria bacterium]|nr:ABC transporter permease [Alphaproteobacteria bacterium]